MVQNSSGTQAGVTGTDPTISADGSLVASFVVVNGQQFINLYDLTRQAAVALIPATGAFNLTLSADGTTVSYSQVKGATANLVQYNRLTQTSVSIPTASPALAGAFLRNDGISGDGSIVAYDTTGNPLNLPGVGNSQAYVYNARASTPTTLISQSAAGAVAGLNAGGQASLSRADGISQDGSTAVFESNAQNLVTGLNASDGLEVYVNNTAGTALRLASATPGGVIADRNSDDASVSANGQTVAFLSDADNLGYSGQPGTNQVYVRDFSKNTLVAASTLSDGKTFAAAGVTRASVSPDGRFVVFASASGNLPGANGFQQIYLKDLATQQLTLVSQDASGRAGQANSSLPTNGNVFSADDSQIVYQTSAANLLPPGSFTTFGIVRATVPVTPVATFDTVAFTDTGVQGDGLTDNPVVTLSGTSANATSIDVRDGTQDLGAVTPKADGSWSLTATLAPGQHNTFSAIASNATAATATATNASSVTVDTTQPSLAFAPTVAIRGGRNATLSGTVSDAAGVSGIEIFEGTKDLGAATANADGTFTFQHSFAKGFHTGLTALVTDKAGNTAQVATDFDLTTGLKQGAVKAQVDNYSAAGDYLGSTYYNANGTVNLKFEASTLPNGRFVNAYTEGTALRELGLSSYKTVLKRNGDVVSNTLNVVDGGSHMLSGLGGFDTYVFKPGFGTDTITDFATLGTAHDTLNLPRADFADLAAVIAGATQSGANTVITAKNGDSLTLQNVALADLSQNNFKFHG